MARAQRATRPENVSVEELREYLTEVEGKTAAQRIMVGINHKEGIPQTQLADWYDVSRTTIHNWLNRLERLEDEPLEEVIYDEDRPGRPPKLDDDERERLEAVLQSPPTAIGYDASTWTPRLVRAYILETFDIEYSLSHVRDLVHESEISRRTAATTDDEDGTRNARQPDRTDAEGRGTEDEPGPDRVHGCRS